MRPLAAELPLAAMLAFAHAPIGITASGINSMTTAWLLNAVGLFVTTVGALLTFLYLYGAPRFADKFVSPEAKRDYAKHQRLIVWAVGLLAAWLVVQYLALILL